MRVAALQFDVQRADWDAGPGGKFPRALHANLVKAGQGLEDAAEAGARLLLLPELWTTSFVSGGGNGAKLLDIDLVTQVLAPLELRLAERAAELGVAVAGSSLAFEPGDELPRNRFTLFDGGEARLVYDKTHLFTPTAEHFAFTPGERLPGVVELDGVRIGALICYDLRFAAPVLELARQAVDLVLVPAQWPRGRAGHWAALLAGRAVETQAWFLGCNRIGAERVGRRGLELIFDGGSALASPEGSLQDELQLHPQEVRAGITGPVVAGAERYPGYRLVVADLDPALPTALRRAVPVERDRRRDL